MCQGQGGMGPSGMSSGMPNRTAPSMYRPGMQKQGMPQTGGAMNFNQPAPSMMPKGNSMADLYPVNPGGFVPPWNSASGQPNGNTGPVGRGFQSPGAPDIPNPYGQMPETGGANFVNQAGPSMLPGMGGGFGGPNVSGMGNGPASPEGLSQGTPWDGGDPRAGQPGGGQPQFDPMRQFKAERQFGRPGGGGMMPETGGGNIFNAPSPTLAPPPYTPPGAPKPPGTPPPPPGPGTPPPGPSTPWRPQGNVRQWDGYGALDDLQGDGALEFTYDPTIRGGAGAGAGPMMFNASLLNPSGADRYKNAGNMFLTDSQGRRVGDPSMGIAGGSQMSNINMTPGQKYFMNYSGFNRPTRIAGMG